MPEENDGLVAEEVQTPSEPDSQPDPTPISLTDAQLESLLKSPALGDAVSEAVKRASQSERDRATQKNATKIADLESQGITEVLETFAALKDEGWNDKQAIRLMNSNLAQKAPEVPAEPVLQGSDTQQPQLDYSHAFTEAGIDPNSPAAIQAAQKAGNDPYAFGVEIGKLQNRIVSEPVTSPAGVAIDGGETAASPPADMESLSVEYQSLLPAVVKGDEKAIERKEEILALMEAEEPEVYHDPNTWPVYQG